MPNDTVKNTLVGLAALVVIGVVALGLGLMAWDGLGEMAAWLQATNQCDGSSPTDDPECDRWDAMGLAITLLILSSVVIVSGSVLIPILGKWVIGFLSR